MALTLTNYATTLAPDLLLQAKKNTVRECDETEKGHFVAYVDEGDDSFDVSLTISGNEIKKHACECKATGKYCRHIAALIIHLTQDEKPKAAVKAKKKESKTDAMLNDIDLLKLKEWVRGLVAKNKDIELSFTNYFSVKEQPTPAGVTKIVNDAVKAVISNKKNIDLTQLKKLVDLWEEMLAPVITHYQANVTSEQSFMNFHTMIESCFDFQRNVNSSSKKIPGFIAGALQCTVEPVNSLLVEESWDKATAYFIAHVPEGEHWLRMHYLLHLKNIMTVSSEERQLRMIDRLATQFRRFNPDALTDGAVYVKFMFRIIKEHDLFPKYGHLFNPIYFDNDYNQELIRLLIDHGDLKTAKKYCRDQITRNFKEEYNIMYYQFLKEIFTIEKDDAGLARVLSVLFPFTFNYDDYVFIWKSTPDEERKKWRTKMLTRARHMASSYNRAPMEFYFKLADEEKSYKKMIDYIESYTPYGVILPYLEKMIQADKDKLLTTLLRKSDSYNWSMKGDDQKEDMVIFPEIYKVLEKYYTANFLKMAISNRDKDRWSSGVNSLFRYIKQQLG